jgi:hypothetical protein
MDERLQTHSKSGFTVPVDVQVRPPTIAYGLSTLVRDRSRTPILYVLSGAAAEGLGLERVCAQDGI